MWRQYHFERKFADYLTTGLHLLWDYCIFISGECTICDVLIYMLYYIHNIGSFIVV